MRPYALSVRRMHVASDARCRTELPAEATTDVSAAAAVRSPSGLAGSPMADHRRRTLGVGLNRADMCNADPPRGVRRGRPGSGNLIPVYRELLADGDTPVSAYAALGAGEHSFLLESVVGGATWAAYSFVGVAPRAVVRWAAGTATRDLVRRRRRRPAAHRRVGDARSDRGARRGARRDAAGRRAGAAAVLGRRGRLDRLRLRARVRGSAGARAARARRCRRCAMVVTDTLLIFDNLRQTLKVVATPYVARPERAEAAYERACARIDAIVATLRAPRRPLPELEPPRARRARHRSTRRRRRSRTTTSSPRSIA